MSGTGSRPVVLFGAGQRAAFGDDQATEAVVTLFADIGAFNEMPERPGRLVPADGSELATTATTVDVPAALGS